MIDKVRKQNENKKYKLYDPECIAYYLNEIFYKRVFIDCNEIIIPVGYTDDNTLDYDSNLNYKKEYVNLLSAKDCIKYFVENIATNGIYKSSTSPTIFDKDNDRIALIDYEWEYNGKRNQKTFQTLISSLINYCSQKDLK